MKRAINIFINDRINSKHIPNFFNEFIDFLIIKKIKFKANEDLKMIYIEGIKERKTNKQIFKEVK